MTAVTRARFVRFSRTASTPSVCRNSGITVTPTIRVAAAFVDVGDRANAPKVLMVSRRVMGIWGTLACYQIHEEKASKEYSHFLLQ